MSEKHTDQTDSENYNPQHTEVSKDYKTPVFVGGNRIWLWKRNFKTLESATEHLLDHIGKLGPIAEELARRNKVMEKKILTQSLTIKTLERGTVNGRTKKRRSKK